MNRRAFLSQLTAVATSTMIPQVKAAESASEPLEALDYENWRTFEITTQIVLPAHVSSAKVWAPLPAFHASDWISPMGSLWDSNAVDAYAITEPVQNVHMLYAEWNDHSSAASLKVVSRFKARDRRWDVHVPKTQAPLSQQERTRYTASTNLLPTDGIVLKTARTIIGSLKHDEDKAQAIYQWIVDNTFRDPKTVGCGVGDIRYMLESGNLSGKCADLNALFVGLARSVGLPARDLYGIRVADSRIGFHSLGKEGDISKAQHCRAEVYLDAHGWVAVDPADVRKVALEEPPGNNTIDSRVVRDARKLLFGNWETNWLAYNDAHDIVLPHSDGPSLPYLMYPQAEIDGHRLNALDPGSFRYQITSMEIV